VINSLPARSRAGRASRVDWQHLFGASVAATIPVFILFALIEGRVIGGLTAGSVK
jgi:multiple sugar transport system permease protein